MDHILNVLKQKGKIVYLPMVGDLVHFGHMNIIIEGRKHGQVVVGLMTDAAATSYKRVPLMTFQQRKLVIENLKGVSVVVAQETLDYIPNLRKIKPDFFIHGDDWKEGAQKQARDRVIEVLKEWNGVLIEPKYTPGMSSTMFLKNIQEGRQEL